MKIRVSGILLNEKLTAISKMHDKAVSKLVTPNIRFVIYIDHITIQAMNEKITFTEDIYDIQSDVEHGKSFSFLVDARTLIDFFKNHKGDITIDVLNNFEIKFSYKNGSFSSVWFEDKAFPEFFSPSGENEMRVMSSFFVPSMKRAFAFVGEDEFRPSIETIYINIKNDHIDLVSTDRFSLFLSRKFISLGIPDKGIMLSHSAAGVIYQFLSDKDTEIRISSDDRRTFICFDNVVITDMNLEFSYPNYERICDLYKHSSKIMFDRDSLLSALNAMSIVNDMITISADTNGHAVVRSEDSGNRKKIEEMITCSNIDGPGFYFFIKKSNMVSSIKNLLKGDVVLEYSEASKSTKMYNPKYESTYILNQTFVG